MSTSYSGFPAARTSRPTTRSSTRGIRHVLVRHEAGGGHAAEGYAKATGKVGVALGTSGPGATNLVTPIMDAMMDSVPVVFITGQVRTELLGTDGFQEADILGITMPAVKHSFMIQHPLEIPRAIHEAFHIARTGRPGPVVVDIPTDLSRADIPYEPVTDVHLPGYQPTTEGNTKQIRQAAKALAAARRPGALRRRRRRQRQRRRRSSPSSRRADRFPVTCTLMGLGRLPGAARAVARDARHARHARGELRDGRGRPDLRGRRALRRPHHRQALASSRRARSSSTSTSTRPRSPRTSRRTSRSSATRRTSSAKLVDEYRALEADRVAPGGVVAADPRLAEQHPLRYDDTDGRRDQARSA